MLYNVLLVDDEEIVCSGLMKFINWESYGFRVVEAVHSVAQALVYMENHAIDVVISDIRMPVQSGLILLEIIQEEYPDIKTIILSSYGDFDYAKRAMKLGVSDYLLKPVNFEELKQVLMEMHKRLEAERIQVSERVEYKRIQINNLLNSLAKGNSYASMVQGGAILPISVEELGYYVARIRIENKGMDYGELQHSKQKLYDLLVESESQWGSTYLFNNELNEIACLFIPLKKTQGVERWAQELLESLHEVKIQVIIGISALYERFIDVKLGYLQAGKALQYRIIQKKSDIVHYQDIEEQWLFEGQVDERVSMELLYILAESTSIDTVITFINQVMDDKFVADELSLNETHAYCIQMMLMIRQHIQSYSGRLGKDSMQYPEIRELLLQSELQDIKEVMNRFILDLGQYIESMDTSVVSNHMIHNIKSYIQEHYAEDISLNVLSSVFYIHPIYLSRLFKEKTGENFIDYLTEIRVNKSKELLKDINLKIYDISQLVGYGSSRYFSKLFKNNTGITPKEYRDRIHDTDIL